MRSNIALTCDSGRVPLRAVPTPPREASVTGLPQRAEEVHEVIEPLRALLLQPRERRHRRRGIDERAGDGLARQAGADLGQVGSRAGVAVVADPVTAEAARSGRDLLPLLVLRRDLQVDLRRRAGERALDREVR